MGFLEGMKAIHLCFSTLVRSQGCPAWISLCSGAILGPAGYPATSWIPAR